MLQAGEGEQRGSWEARGLRRHGDVMVVVGRSIWTTRRERVWSASWGHTVGRSNGSSPSLDATTPGD